MNTESQTPPLASASNARQFLLAGIVMNLLAIVTLMWGDLGMVPGLLFGVGILGSAAGISFIRPSLDCSLFVIGLLWLIACLPGLNLLLLSVLYRQAVAAHDGLKTDRQRAEALLRARERNHTPPPVNAPRAAEAPAVTPRSDTIEFTPTPLPGKPPSA